MSGRELELDSPPLSELAERWRSAWVDGDFGGCCTHDVDYEDPVTVHPLHGRAGLEAHAAGLRAAFPDLRVEQSSPALGDGRNACLTWRIAGTHSGEAGSLPATNRFIALHGVHYVELVDGRVRRARGFFDLYDAATQLGLLPARGGLGETALLLLRGFGVRRRAG